MESVRSPERYWAADAPTSVITSHTWHCTCGFELAPPPCSELAAQSKHKWCSQARNSDALSSEMPHCEQDCTAAGGSTWLRLADIQLQTRNSSLLGSFAKLASKCPPLGSCRHRNTTSQTKPN